ncbi:MAG: response regulator transcription factor [Curvibacter sp.]|nr:MAG: response regulator transcription factor [Curvibacter sp.]
MKTSFEEDLPTIYQKARTLPTHDFQRALLAYLCTQLNCSYGVTNTWHGGDFVAANTYGLDDDTVTRMAYRWVEIGRPDLDVLTMTASACPGRAVFVNAGDPRMQGEEMAVIRAFMVEFDVEHAIAVALDLGQWGCKMLLSLVRGPGQPSFAPHEAETFSRFSPHASECVSINYVLSLAFERSPMGQRMIAVLDKAGNIIQITERFAAKLPALLEPNAFRKTTVPSHWLAAAQDGRPVLLRAERAFVTFMELDGCWLAEYQRPVDGQLTARQLEVALLYANGWSYKDLARDLDISPATARVHLQNVFAKLTVSSRKSLREALSMAHPSSP